MKKLNLQLANLSVKNNDDNDNDHVNNNSHNITLKNTVSVKSVKNIEVIHFQ